MKKKDVKVGGKYIAKISGYLVPVKIISESPYGGWVGKNPRTGREVRIKTAAKLRCRAWTKTKARNEEYLEKLRASWMVRSDKEEREFCDELAKEI